MKPLHFVTSVYGKRYGGMLLNLLYSITHSNPGARVSIFWQDIDETVKVLTEVFPNATFINLSKDMGDDLVDRIANRIHLWGDIIRQNPSDHIVFLDVDMLVEKDISHFFTEYSADVFFTYKDEIYPINGGIALTRASESTAAFFNEWAKKTDVILADPSLKRMSISRQYPYGAPDQMALNQLIGYSRDKTIYTVTIDGFDISVHGIPCNTLNETNSCPITDDMHVIHYKGGWHSILLEGTDFTSRRPKSDSWEMYIHYLTTYRNACAYVRKQLGREASGKIFGVRVPFYLNSSLEESALLYRLFQIRESIRSPLRRVIRYAWKRLRNSR